jgi:mRNA-degrading endonuclease RelE of RelBE toxin-antitoxin system
MLILTINVEQIMDDEQVIIWIDEEKGCIESRPATKNETNTLEYKTYDKVKYEMYSNNKIANRINKQPPNRYQSIVKVLASVSEDPIGRKLPQNNTKKISRLGAVYQYTLGDFRIVWRWDELAERVKILDVDSKNQVKKRLSKGY